VLRAVLIAHIVVNNCGYWLW